MGIALDNFERYTLQAGQAGLLHTDTESKNDLMTGGSRIDALQGGGDVLNGDTGTDQLLGGAGHDLYILRPGFGTVTITDTDKLGKLVFEAARGTPLGIKDAFMYYTNLPLAA